MMRTLRCRGFTLVELLVVVAIIGVLVALLLPAIQAARESARRSQCSNHLKQIGLAFHNFQDTYGWLPTGGRDGDHRVSFSGSYALTRHGWNWTYWILPFLEENTVFDMATDEDDPVPPGSGRNAQDDAVGREAIATYYCPSRRSPVAYGGFYRCDFAGNAGEYSEGGHSSGVSRGDRGVLMMTDHRRTRVELILDGSSNTLMVAEKALHPDAAGEDGGDNERWNNAGWDTDVPRWGALSTGEGLRPIPDSAAPVPPDWTTGPLAPHSFGRWHPYFGSSHPGGINACMADGSVRHINFTVEAEVFRLISLTDTGEAVSLR